MNDDHTITLATQKPNISVRVGDQMVDITKLGDILIEAGQALNDCFQETPNE